MQQSWKTEKLTGEDMKETSRQLSGIKDVLYHYFYLLLVSDSKTE